MVRLAVNWFKNAVCPRFFLAILLTTIVWGNCAAAQTDAAHNDNVPQSKPALPQVGEGCLLYRSPISGRYESVPLTHTDVALDVRGLVASATVTQQYSNSSSTPIEAIYVFPLPHDGAVYDMEIRVGNRVIRSVIKEREEAKKIYEAAKSEGKRAALVEQERRGDRAVVEPRSTALSPPNAIQCAYRPVHRVRVFSTRA